MTLEEDTTIDILGTNKDGTPFLAISDGGQTEDSSKRLELLKKKLLLYVHFIEGEDFSKTFPQKKRSDTKIIVMCSDPPSPAMNNFQAIRLPHDPDTVIPISFEINDWKN